MVAPSRPQGRHDGAVRSFFGGGDRTLSYLPTGRNAQNPNEIPASAGSPTTSKENTVSFYSIRDIHRETIVTIEAANLVDAGAYATKYHPRHILITPCEDPNAAQKRLAESFKRTFGMTEAQGAIAAGQRSERVPVVRVAAGGEPEPSALSEGAFSGLFHMSDRQAKLATEGRR
jgi:hypothetical protein